MSVDLSTKAPVLTAYFVFKSNRAVRIQLDLNSKNSDGFWVPMSQITEVMTEDGEQIEYHELNPNSCYLWRITGWIALKLFDCDGWEELEELELSFLDLD